ncbi:Pr6Pr family membrane protein [Chryseobacterium sp. CT-SW4]|uniref:Pr6Pr family membrane protein n=1 Tax=Chryseobacterium sp. SW-1 TaxID=3157343 RepID=UPI003B027D57
MKKIFALIVCMIGWFAIIAQYYIMINTAALSISETTIRFFSYFTILTHIIVAVYFSNQLFRSERKVDSSFLTAVTVYILMVGIIYQVVLRSSWNPTGLQRWIDELLHGVIPLLTLIYWYFYENKSRLRHTSMIKWSIYPLVYLFYILIRGNFSGFYPYPFINVSEIGIEQTLINSFYVLIFFIIVSGILIGIGKLSRHPKE